MATGFFLVVCLCSELNGIDERHRSEFFLFLTTCTLAMMMLVSSIELLTIYIALELSSYSLYVLVPLRKGRASMWRRASSTSWWAHRHRP